MKITLLKKKVVTCLLILFGLIFGFLLSEAATRIYLRFCTKNKYVGRWQFRKSCPPLHKNADYFCTEFLDESLRCVTGITNPPGTNIIIQGDFAGKYCNVGNGKRRTAYQPTSFRNRVLLFRGSIMFCWEVLDEHTIVSYLQKLLEERGKGGLIVENYGAVTTIAAQQMERLLQTPIDSGDIVIFYDGISEVIYPIFNGYIKGWIPGAGHDVGARKLSPLRRHLYRLALKYSNVSGIAKFLLRTLECTPLANTADEALFQKNVECAERNYWKALIEAHRYVTINGGRFYHFLQPNIFNLKKRSEYEVWLVNNELKQLNGLAKAFTIGYPQLRQAIEAVKMEHVDSFDFTRVFDERIQGKEIYLDCFHCSHICNERVAREIYNALLVSN